MDGDRNEGAFEGLAAISGELIATDGDGAGEEDQFGAGGVTQAMITQDGTTVAITLNPETGQFMTADGQTVQVQMAPDDGAYAEESETVLPDHVESGGVSYDQDGATPFQVISTDMDMVEKSQAQTVVIKDENYSIDTSHMGGNLQLVSGDGQMYIVSSDLSEMGSNIRIVTANEDGSIDEGGLQGGKIRIVTSEAASPRKVTTVNQQQHNVVSSFMSQKVATQEKPKVVIRPAIAPKQESKVQYVRVVGSKPIASGSDRQIVTIRSGAGMPILPRSSGARGMETVGNNVLKIALPSTVNRAQKMQRVILPSENVKVIDSSGVSSSFGEIQSRKVVCIPQASQQLVTPKIEPSTVVTAIETPRPLSEKTPDLFESTGVKPRKPCNCTKSQCLKLYCECFANGEFCNNCNCNNCYNNLSHEEARQRSIKQCLERNPNAFRPKIGKLNSEGDRRHNKGCNCKRSGCLKNYCECYEAKIGCTKNCRCIGCKNIEVTTLGRKPDADSNTSLTKEPSESSAPMTTNASSASSRKVESSLKSKLASGVSGNAFKPVSGVRQPFNFVTNEVVEATCQCLLAQAEEAEKGGQKEEEIEGLIIEEFGRCLSQIIEMANKSS